MKPYLAISSRGLEALLADELTEFGASEIKVANAAVRFLANEKTLYRCCLSSCVASRFILLLSEFTVHDDMDLYLGAIAINWPDYFSSHKRLVVDFNGTNKEIRNSQYGALKIKDAIVDKFTRRDLPRPSIDKERPDLRIHVRLNKNKAMLGIDMVGSGLHQRGYRTEMGVAPLRETHAAALVKKSGWTPEKPLLDLMCGSGTLLIEAAMMAAKIAPGLKRKKWSFESLTSFQKEIWQEVHAQCSVAAKRGLAKCETAFYGFDSDIHVLEMAKANAARAGVSRLIKFVHQDATTLQRPENFTSGIILSNPPYGERLGTTPGLVALYTQLGAQLKKEFKGCTAAIYSGSEELLSCLRMRAESSYKLKNGAIDCVLKTYAITASGETQNAPVSQTQIALDFANRLKKNSKKIEKWAKQQGIEAYRLYDADLPEYNVAIDRYKDHLVIQEYAAPKTVDEKMARRRLLDIVRATIEVTEINANNVVLKTREKQKGANQYQKLSDAKRFMTIIEYGVKLEVNLQDYLDTGLFLDNRYTRKLLGQKAQGKDFLNLFAYTGSATVHAAVGGAKSTTSVDMSKTYLAWAERNLKLNGRNIQGKIGTQHRFIHADCLQWLIQEKGRYDLIFIDPPTFSNSKRMHNSFDVQRDHIQLIQNLKPLLKQGGEIIFSNNKRHFKMDELALANLNLATKNLSHQTLPLDFERNKQIHNCWLIKEK